MIVAHLDRKLFSVGATRYQKGLYTTPDRSSRRYMALLLNRQGGSDCETLAQEFKDFGLGPVIGTRTGEVGSGSGGTNRSVTGVVDAAGVGRLGSERAWVADRGTRSGSGCRARSGAGRIDRGKDVQLDYAIDHLMKKIKAEPRPLPGPPPIPPRPTEADAVMGDPGDSHVIVA